MIPGLGSQIPGLRQGAQSSAGPASELQKLIEAMKQQESIATQQADQVSIPEGAGQLKEVPFGSSLAEAQLKAQTQGPSLGVGESSGDTDVVGAGPASVAQASTKAVAEVASALAKAQYVKEAARRNVEREKLKGQASGKMAASKLEAEGTISPLRNLIANFKAALS